MNARQPTRFCTHPRKIATEARMWVLAVFVGLAAPTSGAHACGGIFDVGCNLTHGGLSPENIIDQGKKAGQDVANALNELQASAVSAPALEQAIISSRNSSMNGAMPMPLGMRRQLTGYISEDAMNRVRYRIGDSGFANLARLIEHAGDTQAVTLIDVIVFRGPSEANDPALWAHELTHVEQYRDWGVHSFAVSYARQWQNVENPAYDKGNNYWNWRRQYAGDFGSPSRTPYQPVNDNPFQYQTTPQMGAFCYTPYGRFGPGSPGPIGAPCYWTTVYGTAYGQIGR